MLLVRTEMLHRMLVRLTAWCRRETMTSRAALPSRLTVLSSPLRPELLRVVLILLNMQKGMACAWQMVNSRVSVARDPLLLSTSATPVTCPFSGRVMILTFALVGRLGLATLRRVPLLGKSTLKTLMKPVPMVLNARRNR